MLDPNKLILSDIDESTVEPEVFSYNEEVSEDIPQSLLSYFEASKSRASVCEKLILEEIEDSPEDENDFVRESTNRGAEQQKAFCEEVQKEEQRRQREIHFQEELKKITEKEKLHKMELELTRNQAQEKIEQELLIQQELIHKLKKRVEQERKMIEEEKKRNKTEELKMKKEEKKKKEDEDRKKRQKERTRMEEKEKLVEMRVEVEKDERKREEKQEEEEEDKNLENDKNWRGEETKKKMKEERKIQEILVGEENMKRSEEEHERKKEEEAQKGGMRNKKRLEEETQVEEEKMFLEVIGNTMRDGKNRKNEKIKFKEEVKKMEKEESGTKSMEEKRREEELREITQMKMNHEEMRQKKEGEQKTKDETGTNKTDKTQLENSEEKRTAKEERLRLLENKHPDEEMDEETRKLKENGHTEDNKRTKQEIKNIEQHGRQREERKAARKTEDEEIKHREIKIFNEKDSEWRKVDDIRGREVDKRHRVEEVKGEMKTLMEETREGKETHDSKTKVLTTNDELEDKKGENDNLKSWRTGDQDSSRPGPVNETLISSETTRPHLLDTCAKKTPDQHDSPVKPSCFSPAGLLEHTEQKRLTWMKDCVSWSKLSLHNRRKQKGPRRSVTGLRRAARGCSPPPLCAHTLLQTSGWKSLQEVTTLMLEDVPSCSLSTLVQCIHLQSLTLRRCGLRSLEGVSQLQELCYIDLQENDISFLDCEDMRSLRVLRLSNNKLTSIHGLSGAERLDVLDLSYNSITRIAGLESAKRLQRLLVDHNQLICTKGLRDVYTLLHLDCSHNHLATVEGLENNALLHTLDLRSNSLTEPPVLNNQVVLRELHLDDNSISSLQGLSVCWLPLLQHFSVAQNRAALQKAVSSLRIIDEQQTDSCVSSIAAQQLGVTLDSFLSLCQAQIQQTQDLQQCHSRQLSNVTSPLDAMKTRCQHFTMALQLAESQRFAHKYGDTSVSDLYGMADEAASEKTMDMYYRSSETAADEPKLESSNKLPPDILGGSNVKCRNWSFKDTLLEESRPNTLDSVTDGPRAEKTVSNAHSACVPFLSSKEEINSLRFDTKLLSSDFNLDVKSRAAVVIQQTWRKRRQKCGNVIDPFFAKKRGERGGDEENSESTPSFINRSVVSQNNAATVIQAFWRGFTLRRRLSSAFAVVTCPDSEEDDAFEEVDVEEFVFGEQTAEKHWTVTEDSSLRHYVATERPSAAEPFVTSHDNTQHELQPPLVWRPKQAWTAGQQEESGLQRISALTTLRSHFPASASALSGLSERSEKIQEEWGFTNSHTALLMLKRAQKMKSAKQKQKKHQNPSVHATLLRNSSYRLSPVEARNRLAQHSRYCLKVGEAERGLQEAERMERMSGPSGGAAQAVRHSNSEHFLPEINSSLQRGGRVQLVTDSAYVDRPHTTGLCADSSLVSQACKGNSYPYRNALAHEDKETSLAFPKKERISFRDDPVQLSGGWGGGKKRDRHKTHSPK
ncbi:leucine-rich repeat and IQ domain-containing protein 1 [Nematolebias whitei]|uniref:leucine-rich repeat and IQ domain-containing protein 1 n=1 Tax=Nematolebias whitei TaxID=451745 RepID=UPI00189BA821|nr:leucine-rich repeat and IQ domain-containing protein 1 [Nematolebias whitei]